MRVLMVCLGNICRSPTAEAALREALVAAGVEDVEVASAGTGTWHLGSPPDARMIAAAAEAGLRLGGGGTARRVTATDFAGYDLILAMDAQNEADLLALAPDEAGRAKVRRFREFDEAADALDVPDPYYGGVNGFARVVTIARAAASGLAAHLAAR